MSKKNDQARAEFLADHHERVVACFEQALANEIDSPVVMLIDPDDAVGDAILAKLADLVPNEEPTISDAGEPLRGVVFAMDYDSAIRDLETVCHNCVQYLEQAHGVKGQIDKANKLMMYMIVSFGMAECKLEPRPAKS